MAAGQSYNRTTTTSTGAMEAFATASVLSPWRYRTDSRGFCSNLRNHPSGDWERIITLLYTPFVRHVMFSLTQRLGLLQCQCAHTLLALCYYFQNDSRFTRTNLSSPPHNFKPRSETSIAAALEDCVQIKRAARALLSSLLVFPLRHRFNKM